MPYGMAIGLSPIQPMATALELKQAGNSAFKRGEHATAARSYEDALAKLALGSDDADLERACRLNLASCHLALGACDACVDQCTRVLQADAGNRKASEGGVGSISFAHPDPIFPTHSSRRATTRKRSSSL